MAENFNAIFDPLKKQIHGTHNITNVNVNAPYHRHNGYEIYLFLNGSVRYYIEDHCYDLKQGDLVLLNKKEMHRVVSLEQIPYERISIYISEACISQLSSNISNLALCFNNRKLGENNVIRLSDNECKQFVSLADCLIESENKENFGDDILIKACCEQLLILVNRKYMSSNHIFSNIMPKLIKEVMKYIEQNIQNEITLDAISKKFFLNGTHISRQFKKHTGLTIRSYIVDRKVAYAKELLNGGKSVTDVAYMSGFNNYSNFIRTFNKIEGISPGKYAKEHDKLRMCSRNYYE